MSKYLNKKAFAVGRIGIFIALILIIITIPIAIGQSDNVSDNESNIEIIQENIEPQVDLEETESLGNDEFGEYAELNETDNLSFFLEQDFEEEEEPEVPQLIAELLTVEDNETNQTNFYFEIVDETETQENVVVEFSEIDQGTIFLDLPVNMYQTVTVTNTKSEQSMYTINLWDYPEQLPSEYVSDSKTITIFSEDELVSEQPIILAGLGPQESKTYTIIYEYEPVHKEVVCETQRISDLLPVDAQIIQSDIDMDTVLNKQCTVRIFHEGLVHYFDVDVYLDEEDSENIKSVYFVEGEQYLEVSDNSIVLPE